MSKVTVLGGIEATSLALLAVEDFYGVLRSYLQFLESVMQGEPAPTAELGEAGRRRLTEMMREQERTHELLRVHLQQLMLDGYQPAVFH